MPLSLSDFTDYYKIEGGGSPVDDLAAGSRDLTLLGSGNAPKPASNSRRRGAQFRSASYVTGNPRCFATANPGTLDDALYVSSKIKSFTIIGWFRPAKSGSAVWGFSPLGGLFSATNMGGTATPMNSGVMALIPGAEGSSRLVVSFMGTYFDTLYATQTVGPATTTPIVDNDYNLVAIRVTGSTTVNNQVDSMTVFHMTTDGVRRVYQLTAVKARSLITYTTTAPANNATVILGALTYTFKTTLTGTPATGKLTYSSGLPTDGQTVVVGDDTYTFRDYVGPGTHANAIIEWNSARTSSSGAKQVDVIIGGFRIVIQWNNTGQASVVGGLTIWSFSDATNLDNAVSVLFKAIHGDYDNDRGFSLPGSPSTGYDAGRTWANRRTTTGDANVPIPGYTKASYEVPIHTVDVGTSGNSNRVAVEYPGGLETWRLRVKGGPAAPSASAVAGTGLSVGAYGYVYKYVTNGVEGLESAFVQVTTTSTNKQVNLTGITTGPAGTTARKLYRTKVGTGIFYLVTTINDNSTTTYSDTTADTALGAQMEAGVLLSGGLAAAGAKSVKIEATWAACRDNLIKAINANGTPGTHYSADITTPNATASAAANSNDIDLTSKFTGSAGNGKPLSTTTTCLSVTAFAGGGSEVAREVLIGGSADSAWANLAAAVNGTGAAGIAYGSGTVASGEVAAEHDAVNNVFRVEAKTAGTAGNSIGVSTTVTGAVVKDQYGDKTVTTLQEGQAAPPFTVASGSRPDQNDLRFLWGGWDRAGAAQTPGYFMGTVSTVGIALKVLTDDECASFAENPPPTSLRDSGWYRAPAKIRVTTKTERMTSWPVPRVLSVNQLFSWRVPVQQQGTRCAVKVLGVEAGRPWSVTQMSLKAELLSGHRSGSRDIPLAVGAPDYGVDRSSPAAKVPALKASDIGNVMLQGRGSRRRRGYAVIARAPSPVNGYPGAYYDATDAFGEAYYLVMLGGTLYQLDGPTLLEIDTGWPQNEIPSVATIGNKTFVLSKSRQKIFLQGSLLDPGVTAPTTAPLFVTNTPNVSGGVVALTPGYEYVSTHFNGQKLTESGPSPATLVVLPPGTGPSRMTFKLRSGPSGTTARRLYRRKAQTETYFLVAEVANNTDLAEVYDESEIPLDERLETWVGIPVTADFPPITACVAHEGMLVGWGDPSDRRRLYISEVGDGERQYVFNVFEAQGEVRACLSHEGRLIVFTDRTVEVIEGDWVRGDLGTLGVGKRVIDASKSAFGPFAVCSARGGAFWVDVNGVHTIGRGWDAKDVTDTLSDDLHPDIQDAIDSLSSSVVMAFNHVSQELWVCLTRADQDANSKNRSTLVFNLAKRQWTKHDHALSWVARVTDGLAGDRFVGVDYHGGVLELDVWDGDGVQGNESWIPGTNAIATIDTALNRITVSGASFPTDGSVRNVSLLLERVSTGDFFRTTILSAPNATTLELAALPSWLTTSDKFHIGGILGYFTTGEQSGGDDSPKVFQELQIGLADATQGRY